MFRHTSRCLAVLIPCMLVVVSAPGTRFVRLALLLGFVFAWALRNLGAARETVLASAWATCFFAALAVWIASLPALRHSLWNIVVANLYTQVLFLVGVFCALQHDWIWAESPRIARLMERLLIGSLPFPAAVMSAWCCTEAMGSEAGLAVASVMITATHALLGVPLKRSENDGVDVCHREHWLHLVVLHAFCPVLLAVHCGVAGFRVAPVRTVGLVLVLAAWPWVPGTLLRRRAGSMPASDAGSAIALTAVLVLAGLRADAANDSALVLLGLSCGVVGSGAIVASWLEAPAPVRTALAVLALALGVVAEQRVQPPLTFLLVSSLGLLALAEFAPKTPAKLAGFAAAARLLPAALGRPLGPDAVVVGVLACMGVLAVKAPKRSPMAMLLAAGMLASLTTLDDVASLAALLASLAWTAQRARGRVRRLEYARVLICVLTPLIALTVSDRAAAPALHAVAQRTLLVALAAGALVAVDGVVPDLAAVALCGLATGAVDALAGLSALAAGAHVLRPSAKWALGLVLLTCVTPTWVDVFLCSLCAWQARSEEEKKALAWTAFSCAAWLARSPPLLGLVCGAPLLIAWPLPHVAVLAGAAAALSRVALADRSPWVLATVPGWLGAAHAASGSRGSNWVVVPLQLAVAVAAPASTAVRVLAGLSVLALAGAHVVHALRNRRPAAL